MTNAWSFSKLYHISDVFQNVRRIQIVTHLQILLTRDASLDVAYVIISFLYELQIMSNFLIFFLLWYQLIFHIKNFYKVAEEVKTVVVPEESVLKAKAIAIRMMIASQG